MTQIASLRTLPPPVITSSLTARGKMTRSMSNSKLLNEKGIIELSRGVFALSSKLKMMLHNPIRTKTAIQSFIGLECISCESLKSALDIKRTYEGD